MKNVQFLNKIFLNKERFDNLLYTILKEFICEKFNYKIVKNQDNYTLEITRDNDIITAKFDDFSMRLKRSDMKDFVDISSIWQNLFYDFLTDKEKPIFKKIAIEKDLFKCWSLEEL